MFIDIFKQACNKYSDLLKTDQIYEFLQAVADDESLKIKQMADDFMVTYSFGMLLKYSVVNNNDVYNYAPILMRNAVNDIKYYKKLKMNHQSVIYLQCISIESIIEKYEDINIKLSIDFNKMINVLKKAYPDVDFSEQTDNI